MKRAIGLGAITAIAIGIAVAVSTGSQPRPPDRSPTPSVAASVPAQTSGPVAVAPKSVVVYFARDGLPPIRGSALGSDGGGVSGGISARLDALRGARSGNVPSGAFNLYAPGPRSDGAFGLSVRIVGDTAEVEFDQGSWSVRGATASRGLLQQLVYTITEDPAIKRALIKEKGKPSAVIDQLLIDRPLTREDTLEYASPGSTSEVIEGGAIDVTADVVDWRGSVDTVAPGLARMVVELKHTVAGADPWDVPQFIARAQPITAGSGPEQGKWAVRLELPGVRWIQPQSQPFVCCALKSIDKTPLRVLSAGPLRALDPVGVVFEMVLDDLRPWRVVTLSDPLRVVVDVGGHPQATSESVAVYSPRPGDEIARDVVVSGLARAFEAGVGWRVVDLQGRGVANGFTTASLGVGPPWGAFETRLAIPAGVSGAVTIEVFWPSPRDGSDLGLVRVPVRVR